MSPNLYIFVCVHGDILCVFVGVYACVIVQVYVHLFDVPTHVSVGSVNAIELNTTGVYIHPWIACM